MTAPTATDATMIADDPSAAAGSRVTASVRQGGPSRRAVVAGLAATLASPRVLAQVPARVVVVGGGFAGATCARVLARAGLDATLVEPSAAYTACPMSNAVLAGLRPLAGQVFGYAALRDEGITIAAQDAAEVDAATRTVRLNDGTVLPFDRAVLAPGIAFRYDAIRGYSAEVANLMPHAWRAGAQTALLSRQLAAMDDGGTVVMSVPANPYRCPPGPYERASLIAWYLKERKPRSKLIVLDAKDQFSKQRLFVAAWKQLYGDRLEWVGQSGGGTVTEVLPGERTLVTEFGRFRADVANVIPPQSAASIARDSGAADATGWCPVNPATFESRLLPNVHVIGDAAVMGAMPKSAFAANAQAKVCGEVVAMLLRGETPPTPKLVNTCYSLVAPGYAISVAGVYTPRNGILADVEGAGGTSPLDAPASVRAAEAGYAEAWFGTITAETFG